MVGGTSKETNWSAAFRAAEKHPEGELVNVHGHTLRSMEKAGSAYRRDGKWYMKGKGPGPVEEPKIEEPVEPEQAVEVKYTVQDTAMWQVHLDVEGAPDTTHRDAPGGAIRPAGVSMGIGVTDGVWSVSVVNVYGQKVKGGKVVTSRNYPIHFMDPLGEDSDAPEWLHKICQDWVDKANGVAKAYAAEKARRQKKVSPQRQAFDSALNVLLMRENLDGAQWAIDQIKWMASVETPEIDRMLTAVAERIEKSLDKRTAELAAQNRGD